MYSTFENWLHELVHQAGGEIISHHLLNKSKKKEDQKQTFTHDSAPTNFGLMTKINNL